jgi:CubicO group peptidase (beta-lactamase class C family)
MADVQGTCEARFDGVRRALSDQLDRGDDVGASVAISLHGDPVVDIWGGYVDEAHTAPWERDTITNVWSTTKTMTFITALILHDRGELDFHAPVATYWPEFAAAGKEKVEVRHLMGHTAGLAGWDTPLVAQDLADWEKCTAALAAQAPWWEPGTASGYHAVTQGYLIGEVVRRITGESIGSWFAREVAKPLEADFHIGLSESEDHRVSNVIPPPPITANDFGASELPEFLIKTFLNPPIDASMAHHDWWRRAEIPAANGQGNARSVAAVQSVIAGKGQARGVRLFSEKTAEVIFEEQAQGIDKCLGVPLHFGMGYGLANPDMPIGPRTCYWGGYGGSVIIMDLETELTVCYVMNRMFPGLVGDLRGMTIAIEAATAIL